MLNLTPQTARESIAVVNRRGSLAQVVDGRHHCALVQRHARPVASGVYRPSINHIVYLSTLIVYRATRMSIYQPSSSINQVVDGRHHCALVQRHARPVASGVYRPSINHIVCLSTLIDYLSSRVQGMRPSINPCPALTVHLSTPVPGSLPWTGNIIAPWSNDTLFQSRPGCAPREFTQIKRRGSSYVLGKWILGYLKKGIQTPMARGRST